jgi:hypothetical protein
MNRVVERPVAARASRKLAGFVAMAVMAGFVAMVSRGSADAPTGRYQITTSLVSDLKTGLVWQRNVPANEMNHAPASQYCADLSLGGSSDYRLPHVKELLTLVDETRSSPAMDSTAFANAPSAKYWTASAFPNSPTVMYAVDFSTGVISGGNFTMGTARVRCVRGGG